MVEASAPAASTASGAGRWDGRQAITKGTSSPADTTNVASWAMSFPVSRTGLRSHTESGPATAVTAPVALSLRTQGMIFP